MNADRIYSALLRAYPAAFREEYGGEMLEAFRAAYASHQGSRAALWRFLVWDLARASVVAHVRYGPARWAPFLRRWAFACAGGAAAAALLASGLAGVVSYFYHPYLEGLAIPPWAYGAVLGAALGSVQALALRARLGLGATWIATTSCGAAFGFQMAATLDASAPVAYGVILGLSVGCGQWALLRTRVARPARWVIMSAAALAVAVCTCASLLHATFAGLDPVVTARDMGGIPYRAYQSYLATVLIAEIVTGTITAMPLGFIRAHQKPF